MGGTGGMSEVKYADLAASLFVLGIGGVGGEGEFDNDLM
jgi:hypothetical protein